MMACLTTGRGFVACNDDTVLISIIKKVIMRMECAVCSRRKLPPYGNLCVRMFADLLDANHNARCTHCSLGPHNLPHYSHLQDGDLRLKVDYFPDVKGRRSVMAMLVN